MLLTLKGEDGYVYHAKTIGNLSSESIEVHVFERCKKDRTFDILYIKGDLK